MLLEFVQWTNDGESLETTFGCYLGIEINIFICTHVGSLGQENSRKSLKNHHMSLNYAQPSVHSNAHYKTWIWPSFFLHHKQTFCSIKILSTDIPTVDKLQRVFFFFLSPVFDWIESEQDRHWWRVKRYWPLDLSNERAE